MRIFHPATEQYADDVEPEAFELTYKLRGWVEAPDLAVTAAAVDRTPELSVKEVLAAVGTDPSVAAAVLEAEKAGQNRKTLVTALERLATPATPATPQAPAAESTEEPTA